MTDSEDFSGLLESKIECISRKIAKEELAPLANAVDSIQKDISSIQKSAIALLITILLTILGYFGTKLLDKQLDKNNRIEMEKMK